MKGYAQMKRIAEHLKNITLAVLFVLTLVLVTQLWMQRGFDVSDEGLPPKYSGTLFEKMFNYFSDSNEGETELIIGKLKEKQLKPYIVGKKLNKTVYCSDFTEKSINECAKEAFSILKQLLSSARQSGLTEGENAFFTWFDALKNEGIYIDFGKEIPIIVLRAFLAVNSFELDDHEIRYIYIVRTDKGATVYLTNKDKSVTAFIECNDNITDKEYTELDEKLAAASMRGMFVFDADDEAELENTVAEQTLLLLQTGLPEFSIKRDEFSLFYLLDDSIIDANTSIINTVLSAFGYNIHNLNSYQLDRSMIYVQRDTTVRIYEDGQILYNAQSESNGLSVVSLLGTLAGGTMDVGQYARAAYSLILQLDQSFIGGTGATAELIKTVYDESDRRFDFYFGYNSGGISIENEKGYHIKISIKDGYITEADIALCSYSMLDRSGRIPATSTVFIFNDESAEETMYVEDAMLYMNEASENEDKLIYPQWVITAGDGR